MVGRLKLVIVHSHYRPGGVRRVIELAVPHLAADLPQPATEVVLVGGEAPDPAWLALFSRALRHVPVTCAVEPALGYFSEQRIGRATMRRRIRAHLARCLSPGAGPAVVWAHNPGLGRNLILTRELIAICDRHACPLVFHQHDWWFENRWARWREMREAGFRTLDAVATVIFPASPGVRHATINHTDALRLRRHLGERAGWLPNPAARAAPPPVSGVRRARQWLTQQLGDPGPVWLVPARLLRRKNVAEALLLTRWLRPGAWLVTTGAVSSAEEAAYGAALAEAAQKHGWRLRLTVLAADESAKPSVSELLGASEVVLQTSLQEGFGLPNLEAAAAARPLITRRLPNIAPDLRRFGFRFPQAYDEVQVDPRLFDLPAETRRQAQRWQAWRAQLPRACRALTEPPGLPARASSRRAVPFSRLTLVAQFEVLAHPAEYSWELCAPLNPHLPAWRQLANAGALAASGWPPGAARWLGGAAYARRFARLLKAKPAGPSGTAGGRRLAAEFIRAKLGRENQYPLLWTSEP